MAADVEHARFRRWARLHDPGDAVGALAAFYVDANVKAPGDRCTYCGSLIEEGTDSTTGLADHPSSVSAPDVCEHCSDLPGLEPTGGW